MVRVGKRLAVRHGFDGRSVGPDCTHPPGPEATWSAPNHQFARCGQCYLLSIAYRMPVAAAAARVSPNGGPSTITSGPGTMPVFGSKWDARCTSKRVLQPGGHHARAW